MKVFPGVFLGSALILASVGAALGQGTVDVQGPIDAQGNMQAANQAGAGASDETTLNPIRERARKASMKTCAAVQKQLGEISRQIDAEANEKGDVLIAGRMAPEFGMTAQAMTAEQTQFNTGMGEIMIAHTLMANSKTAVTVEQLFRLHQEGLGWGQIARGLNLKINEVAAAMSSEQSVASGRAKADGKVAMIHSDTKVATSTKTGSRAGSNHAGTASSVGVGLGVGN